MIRLIGLWGLCLSAGCSTYVENEASAAFQPIISEETSLPRPANGSIYHAGAVGLFAVEQRASRVGDVLTVALNESFQAIKSQSASAGNSDSVTADLPNFLGMNDLSFSSDQTFAGSGAAAQSNSFTGLVTVSIVRVFSNGNLEVLGQKKLTLNNGDEYVRVSGIVRRSDISPSNVVNSNRIANAEITYIGAGDVADTGRRGLFSRVLSSLNLV
ncbi:flagellar basal-body L-ring protein FlgH [Octadecabacter antarcticus 307]|uniref:Flagellar L-ring protein n=1 Tax=Octadecabacter antarcticus 307 TaxID=391626 RepID=M9R9R0_9RHOB|nr:flagellar basal body L-ring protein FlgH [Octadecabacter antarcticus]AGI68543.1 flagellar basal-body L-ring protein FlgH [Octadecabacter antarcticus 307]